MPLHLFLVHFPVALVTVGAAADLAGALAGRVEARRWAGVLLVLGAAAAALAFFTGGGALSYALARVSPVDPALEAHTRWGGAGVWPLLALGALRLAWRRRLDGAHGWALLAAALASAALVVAITVTGTRISHGAP